jgi:two-component system, NarL family, invasion response regulator UvrY
MIRIGIVDDHAIVRLGLRDYLQQHADIEVAGEAGNGQEALELVRNVPLDVLVMDLNMPGHNGVDAMTRIRALAPMVAILIFTAYPREGYASNLSHLGAKGILCKDCDLAEVLNAIREVARASCQVTDTALSSSAASASFSDNAPHHRLSAREFQIFLKLADGKRLCAIAPDLELSKKTVSTYRGRIMGKLGLSTTSDLTYYAMKYHLLD